MHLSLSSFTQSSISSSFNMFIECQLLDLIVNIGFCKLEHMQYFCQGHSIDLLQMNAWKSKSHAFLQVLTAWVISEL